jgi:hypothetical protein
MPKGVRPGGRQKGTPNKFTASARTAFALAFSNIGGVEELTKWAKKNQTEFYKLYARLIPQEVHGQIDVTDKSQSVQAVDRWLQEALGAGAAERAEGTSTH